MFGPMLIIYLVSLPGLDKERFVASISFSLYRVCCAMGFASHVVWGSYMEPYAVIHSGDDPCCRRVAVGGKIAG